LLALAAALAMICGVERSAAAHPLDMGYLKVETGEAIAVSFDIDVVVAAQLLHVDAAKADAAVIAARATELAAATYRAAAPSVDGQACSWGTPIAQLRGRNVTIEETLTCPAGAVSWELPFVKKMSSTFQVLARVRTGEQEQIVTLDKTAMRLGFGTTAISAPAFGEAAWTGVRHAGVFPSGWPDGLDHLVFVLALLLAGGALGRLAGLAGAFGVMHLVGAMLAANGVALPATLQTAVPAFALTIAIAALIGKSDPWRTIAAIAAGALHGLASAPGMSGTSGTSGTTIAGVGFTLGLALVQLAIVVGFAPLVAMVPAAQTKRYLPAAAVVVALASAALLVRSFV
jgi:hypothetical protein